MGDLTIKPNTGGVLKLQDAGSTDRITVTDGGTTVLNEDGGAAALTVETSGDVTVETGDLVIGTADKGIDFSGAQTAAGGTTDEVLSGYEKGVWTVTATDGGGKWTLALDSDYNSGSYVKIGDLVQVQAVIRFDAPVDTGSGSAGGLKISLPFTAVSGLVDASGTGVLCLGGFGALWDAWTGKTPYSILDPGTNYFIMRASAGDAEFTSMANYANDNSRLSFSGSYRV